MTIGLALNIIIILLLLVTITFAIRLGKKITRFNQVKEELVEFIESFNSSILRAENTITELKTMGSSVDNNLQSQLKKARFLANDLSFLTEKGENVAEVLESKISMSRDIYRKVSADSIIMQSNQGLKKKSPFPEVKDAGNKEIKNTNIDHQSLSKPNKSKKGALDSLLKQIAQKKAEINS